MQLRRLADADIPAVIQLWHDTKRATYTFLATERGRTLAQDDDVFRAHILARCEIWLALEAGQLLGFLALAERYLDRLYVAPSAQRAGVGHALFAKACELSPDGFGLHTHVQNRAARAFYEKQGCTVVRFGISPAPECAPDVEYHWRPPDARHLPP